jgi:hypothetical protein
MDYILRFPCTDSDCEFLNQTSVEFEIIDTERNAYTNLVTQVDEGFDSGWCDMDTGARIMSDRDRVVFRNVESQDQTLLVLKFGDRLKKLTQGLSLIYSVAYSNNTDPINVMDDSIDC